MAENPEKCFITDLEAKYNGITRKVLAYSYYVEHDNEDYFFNFSKGDTSWKEVLKSHKHILKGLFFNKHWSPKPDAILTKEELNRVLSEFTYPKTYKEKFENFLTILVHQTKYDGKKISPQSPQEIYYFENWMEYKFYWHALNEAGFVSGSPDVFQVTFQGLNKSIELLEGGINSKRCFIAMSFADKEKHIRESIRNAISQTGYESILIDEIHDDADRTINDLIIAEIKRSKFIVADFTAHSKGVYFEAGFALGRGLKVIYTCSKNDWTNTHFDTNHFPHIIYESLEDLEEKLIHKIDAWIS